MKYLLKRVIISLMIASIWQPPVLAGPSNNKPIFEVENQNLPHKAKQESSAKAFWRDHKGKIIVGSALVVAALLAAVAVVTAVAKRNYIMSEGINNLARNNEILNADYNKFVADNDKLVVDNNECKNILKDILYQQIIEENMAKGIFPYSGQPLDLEELATFKSDHRTKSYDNFSAAARVLGYESFGSMISQLTNTVRV